MDKTVLLLLIVFILGILLYMFKNKTSHDTKAPQSIDVIENLYMI